MLPIDTHVGEVMYFGCVCFRGELGFLNCDDICMCVVNKQFELLEFVFDSIYGDLQYDEIYLNFTAGSVVMWLSLVCLRGCGGCCNCDVAIVVRVTCVFAVRMRGLWQCCCGCWRRCVCGECRACGWYTLFRYCV